MTEKSNIKAILFDLDGTLIDSAPDLGAAGDKMRTDRGLPSYPLEEYRKMAGAGARGIIGVAFGIPPDDERFPALREEFFKNYEACLTERTAPFNDILELLHKLEERGILWGIVTNKAERFFLPLAEHFQWHKTAAALIGGDTTAHSKPHPLPILEAAKRMNIVPEHCLYVGDDLRDVQAGNAAHAYTAAATWGYLGVHDDVAQWEADYIVHHPLEIIQLLED